MIWLPRRQREVWTPDRRLLMAAPQQALFMKASGLTDPNFANVVLLAKMNGTNGSTTFTDSSSYARTITAHSTAKISTAQSKFGGASGLFAGTHNATTNQTAISVADSADVDFGSGDFTVEFWIFLTSLADSFNISHGLVSKRASTAVFSPINIEASFVSGPFTRLKGQVSTSGASWVTCQSTTNLSANTWYHVALTRNGSDLRLFLDGTQQGSTQTVSGALMTNSAQLTMAAASTNRDYGLKGHMDELRITKGVARYTANFTAPTAEFPTS